MKVVVIPLTSEQENRLITLVAAYSTSEEDRLDLIGSAGLDRFIEEIPFQTSAKNFARYLIRVLQRHGILESTKTPALIALLGEMRERVIGRGEDLKFIEDLFLIPPQESEPPALPSTPIFKLSPPQIMVGSAILILLMIIGGIIIRREFFPPPTPVVPMAGGFNVVVAGFGAVDANGNPIVSKDALDVSRLFKTRLEQAIEANLNDIAARPQVRYVETTPLQQTTNPTEWEKISLGLATSHNADVIVYGLLEPSDIPNTVTFRLLFFSDYAGFEREKNILDGSNALGAPISINSPFNAEIFAGQDVTPLDIRPQALALLVVGLAFEVNSNNYERALSYYERALAIQGWQEKGEGKEIAYLLAGNAVAQSVARTNDITEFENGSTKAEDYFFRALEVNPNYGRAMIGLHGIHYSRAIFAFTNGEQIEGEEHLTQAEQWLAQAILPENNIPSANLSTKAHYGNGQIYLVRFYTNNRDTQYLEFARTEFMTVINTYEQTDAVNQLRLRSYNSDAHARLALILKEEGKFAEASREYAKAAEGAYPFYQAQYLCLGGTQLVTVGDKSGAQVMLDRANTIIRFRLFDPLPECIALDNAIRATATPTITLTTKPSAPSTVTASSIVVPSEIVLPPPPTPPLRATATLPIVVPPFPTEILPLPQPTPHFSATAISTEISPDPTSFPIPTQTDPPVVPSEPPTPEPEPIPTEIFPPVPPTPNEPPTPEPVTPEPTGVPIPTEILPPVPPTPTEPPTPEPVTPEPSGVPIPTEIFPPATVAPLPRCEVGPCESKQYGEPLQLKGKPL